MSTVAAAVYVVLQIALRMFIKQTDFYIIDNSLNLFKWLKSTFYGGGSQKALL